MPDLLADYPPPAGGYHELLDAKGKVRPHWRRLFEQLERSRPEQLAQREAMLARQIQENGVTYNVYADPDGADRPWKPRRAGAHEPSRRRRRPECDR